MKINALKNLKEVKTVQHFMEHGFKEGTLKINIVSWIEKYSSM